MPPIRIGFIGLSSKPDCWATLAHIPYLRQSPHYEIVALCNSTPAHALESIAAHHLAPPQKTPGPPPPNSSPTPPSTGSSSAPALTPTTRLRSRHALLAKASLSNG